MSITPHQHQIMQMYLSGMSGTQIAQQLGLNPSGVYAQLRNPLIKSALAERFREMDMQLLEFKLKAITEADASLDKLINLRGTAKDERLQRDCSKDIIEIAGLMPQKRVLIRGELTSGITADVVEFFDEVIAEAEIVTGE